MSNHKERFNKLLDLINSDYQSEGQYDRLTLHLSTLKNNVEFIIEGDRIKDLIGITIVSKANQVIFVQLKEQLYKDWVINK